MTHSRVIYFLRDDFNGKNCIFKDIVSIMGGRVSKNPNLEIRTHFSREGEGKKNVFLNSQGENILI